MFSRFVEHVSRNRFVVPVFFFGCGAGVTLFGAYSAVPGSGLRYFHRSARRCFVFQEANNVLLCASV
jgi:hypothetical protein